MKLIVGIVAGILIAVAVFVIFPSIFYGIVHYVQLGLNYISDWLSAKDIAG